MKQFARITLTAILASSPVFAMAAGTITFTGKVIDQTCQVKINGLDSPTITLPTVSTEQLKNSGETAGLTPFKVTVSGCKKDAHAVAIDTVFSGAPITDSGNLKNIHPTPASNVEIQLTQDSLGTQPIALTSVTYVKGLNLAGDTDSAEYEFAALYYAAGPASAGDVQAVLNYDITYE